MFEATAAAARATAAPASKALAKTPEKGGEDPNPASSQPPGGLIMRAMTVSKKNFLSPLESTQYRRTTAAPGWGSGAWTRAAQEGLVLLAPLNSTTSQEEGAKKAAKAKNHLTLDWHCQEAQIICVCEGNPKESQETGSPHGQESNQELREYES